MYPLRARIDKLRVTWYCTYYFVRARMILLHIAQQLSDLFVESLSDTAERETRIQLAALNNYPGRRKKNRRPHQFEFSLRPLVAASTITARGIQFLLFSPGLTWLRV